MTSKRTRTRVRDPEFNPAFVPDVVKVTHRDDLSLVYKVLRIAVLWPLRPHLVSYKKRYPGGSLRLYHHPQRLHGVTIREKKVSIPATSSPADYGASSAYAFSVPDTLWMYDFEPPSTGFEPAVLPTVPPAPPPPLANARFHPAGAWASGGPGTRRKSNAGLAADAAEAAMGPHTIYYFAGGGFRKPPSSEHFRFCARLASALSLPPLGNTSRAEKGETHAHVVLVSYPLAPHSPARDSLPLLRRWLEQALAETAQTNGTVALAGDSAGANVALSLGLWVADRIAALEGPHGGLVTLTRSHRLPEEAPGYVDNNKNSMGIEYNSNSNTSSNGESAASKTVASVTDSSILRRLKSIMAISPATDLRPGRHSASRADADARDKVLGQAAADEAAMAWVKGSGTDGQSRYLSPGLADLTNLRGSGIQVDGVIGTADVLAHDSMVFLQRCREEEIPGRWLVWEGEMHCFPLAACYGLREGRQARDWVAEVLRGAEQGNGRRRSSVSFVI